MANILEFLRSVLIDHDAQRAFQSDPAGFLRESSFADLTGEDVVEAVAVLRTSLPQPVAAGLEPFASRQGLPPVGPYGAESELDAAVRVLRFAVDRVPTPVPVPVPAPPPPITEVPVEQVGSFPPPTAHEPEPAPAPFPAEAATTSAATVEVPESVGSVTFDLTSLPSVAAFAESLESAAADARRRHDEAVQHYADITAQHARAVADRLAEVLPQLQQEVDAVRSAAEASVAQLRTDAAADREAARAALDQARREAEEILSTARVEADAGRREITARRNELREAEEQLRDRLSGIDSLFRKVLDDEGHQSGP